MLFFFVLNLSVLFVNGKDSQRKIPKEKRLKTKANQNKKTKNNRFVCRCQLSDVCHYAHAIKFYERDALPTVVFKRVNYFSHPKSHAYFREIFLNLPFS